MHPVFRPGGTLARVTISLLVANVVVLAAAIISTDFQINLLESARQGHSITPAMAHANNLRQEILSMAVLLLMAVTAIFFLIWVHRTSRNLRALGATHTRFSPGWAVGYWFIPIISLWRPYQVMQEIRSYSTPLYEPDKGSSLIGVWWGLWIISGLAGRAAKALYDIGAGDIEKMIAGSWGTIITYSLSAATGIFAAVMVYRINRGQSERFATPALVPPPAPGVYLSTSLPPPAN
jgi:hypothetical protein